MKMAEKIHNIQYRRRQTDLTYKNEKRDIRTTRPRTISPGLLAPELQTTSPQRIDD